MKKLISLVLAFVLIFSFGATVFAYPDDFEDELSAQNFIAYYVYWIWSDFSDKIEDLKTWQYNSMLQLIDINDFMRSTYSELESLNNNLFGDNVRLEPFADTLENYLSEIVEVLANPEDEQLIEDTKANKDSIISNFFSPSSSNSLNTDDIGEFSGFVTDFKSVFDSSVVASASPFEIFQSDSQALLWFSESTALAIDPNYSGGGGGGIEPDPDNPDPDNPDPDNPDPDNPDPDNPDPDNPDPDNPDPDNPDPDNPDPDNPDSDNPDPDNPDPDNPDPDNPDPDNPDPEPVVNLVLTSTSSLGGTSIYNGIGYKDDTRLRLSGYTLNESTTAGYCSTGFINLDSSSSNTLYIYGFVQGSSGNIYKTPSGLNWSKVTIPSPDANGVITVTIPSGQKAVRVCSNSLGSNLIVSLEYPIQTKASTFSLRNNNSVNSNDVVTNYYGARNYLFNLLFGWGD